MDIDYTDITYLKDPDLHTLQGDHQQFLLSLVGLTIIDITGQEENEWRVVNTLLYGDEPSGLIAIHRWLTSNARKSKPQTNIRFIFCSVESASLSPVFTHRFLTCKNDLNRFFSASTVDENIENVPKSNIGVVERAQLIKQKIAEVSPQAVIDIHNTSGSGPAFSFSSMITPEILTISSFFCDTIILSNMGLGSLSEVKAQYPIIEVECGARNDEQAHEVAYDGLTQFIDCENFSLCEQQKSIQIVNKPLRLKLKKDTELHYGEHDEGEDGVTLKSTIEQFNFGSADAGQMLGWVDNKGLDNFELISACKENVMHKYFSLRENQLIVAEPMKIFMATTNKDIAENDCLFYLVKKSNNIQNSYT